MILMLCRSQPWNDWLPRFNKDQIRKSQWRMFLSVLCWCSLAAIVAVFVTAAHNSTMLIGVSAAALIVIVTAKAQILTSILCQWNLDYPEFPHGCVIRVQAIDGDLGGGAGHLDAGQCVLEVPDLNLLLWRRASEMLISAGPF